MPRLKHINEKKLETLNIPGSILPKGLRETLQKESDLRGMNLKLFVGACLEYAVTYQSEFEEPLSRLGVPGGDYIGALVPLDLREKLERWASRTLRTRGSLLAYILQSIVEQKKYDTVLRFKQQQHRYEEESEIPEYISNDRHAVQ